MAYSACLNASSSPPQEGSIGAGTGATIGKLLGIKTATKGGIGTISYDLGNGGILGGLVVVNAFGDVFECGEIIAGVRNSPDGKEFLGSVNLFKQGVTRKMEPFESTTLAVIATNVEFSKSE